MDKNVAEKTFWAEFVTGGGGGERSTWALIMQSGVTHGLISSHWAINYTKAAATNFCGAVADDRWSVHAATSAKLLSFFHDCVTYSNDV